MISPVPTPDPVSVHFFSLALNVRPLLEHQWQVLGQLPFPWHWHVVEGLADHRRDSAVHKAAGGRITEDLHCAGLSRDGTTEFLDRIARERPRQVTVHRKGPGQLWDGQVEMANAALADLREECLLWRLDPEECWTAGQLVFARQLFSAHPDHTAAVFSCHEFVGPGLVVKTPDAFGNATTHEWTRAWRWRPGARFVSHEPAALCAPNAYGEWIDLATLHPFSQHETESLDLVFQRFTVALESQVEFLEIYAGRRGAVDGWRRLQGEACFPVRLRDYVPGFHPEAEVVRASAARFAPLFQPSQSAPSVPPTNASDPASSARAGIAGAVPASAPPEEIRSARRILVARTDGLAGALLTGPLFRALRHACPEAQLAVLTDEGADEFYTAHPCVEARIVFHPTRAARDESCRRALIDEIAGFAPDLILNPMYSSDAVTEELILSQPGARVIGFAGDAVKLTLAERHRAKRCYTHLLPGGGPHHSERARMQEFLKALGLENENAGVAPTPSIDAERTAQEFFLRTGLDPQRTVALCLGGSSDAPEYPHWEEALRPLEGFQCLILGGSEMAGRGDDLVRRLSGRAFNFAGRTNLPQMASLLRRCRLCVTSDPGVACLADALGVAHVVVAGGGEFGRYLPWSDRSTVACLPLECYGCHWRCRYETIHCLEHVAPEVVAEAMTGTIALAGGSPRIYVPADSVASSARPHRVSWRNVFGSTAVPADCVEHVVVVHRPAPADRTQAWGALAANM